MKMKKALIASAAGIGLAGTAAGIAAVYAGRELWRRSRLREDFRGQCVVVTGGSRGLGFAIAQEFARRGAKLVICARDEGPLRDAECKLRALGAEVLAIPCDVSQEKQAASLIAQASDAFGGVDVLVNNAGQIAVGPIESQTVADFEEAMQSMFWAHVYTTLAVLPQMKPRRRGHIANITSVGGKVAIPHLIPYSSAKFAAMGFSEGMHAELAKDGIKVTTVVPGLMCTGSHMNAVFKGDHRKEYGWFSLAATLPFTAMDARRAARKIVNAIERSASEIVLTPQAKALTWLHGMVPGTVTDVLGLTNRFMPGTGSREQRRFTGKESESLVSRSFLTKLGRTAGRDLNQYPERGPVGGDAHASSRPLGPRAVGGNTSPVLGD
jgi:short-subunit dehydrogenase